MPKSFFFGSGVALSALILGISNLDSLVYGGSLEDGTEVGAGEDQQKAKTNRVVVNTSEVPAKLVIPDTSQLTTLQNLSSSVSDGVSAHLSPEDVDLVFSERRDVGEPADPEGLDRY